MNKVIICGNIGATPELKTSHTGKVWARISVATNESWTNDQGNKETRTTWHQVVCFGNMAENAAKYLEKGAKILVEGKLTYSTYTREDGSKGNSVSILADTIQYL